MRKRQTHLKKGMQKAVLSASLLLCGTVAMAQSQKSGVITDSNGEPLVGVTVMEQGTTNGTVTDINGRYTITTKKPGAKLKVSYVGYEDRVITPGQSVVLKDDNKMLNEVVVVGYGTMRRKDVTSSITTVNAEDLNKGVYSDAASLLQGKVAGLVVTTSGDPNGTPSITLRGASSLRTGEAIPTTSRASTCCATLPLRPSTVRKLPTALSSSTQRKAAKARSGPASPIMAMRRLTMWPRLWIWQVPMICADMPKPMD